MIMAIRGCRIAVGFIALFALFAAVGLTVAAVSTPHWQVANMEQVNQLRIIGLYQSCTYAQRQGSLKPPLWICTFIPYGNTQQFRHQIDAPAERVDYTANGGESWRLATLILLMLAAFFGFLSFAFEVAEICLDATRTLTCLKATSVSSLAALVLGTLCCIIGMMTFAIESQQDQNLYLLELTAFTILKYGQSFYIGIAAALMYIIALGIDIGGMTLICVTAKPHRIESRHRIFFVEGADASASLPLIDSTLNKQKCVQVHDNAVAEPTAWKYPKFTWE